MRVIHFATSYPGSRGILRESWRGASACVFSMLPTAPRSDDDTEVSTRESPVLLVRMQPKQLKRDLMNSVIHSVKNFLVSEDGPTAVEYAVMLALIVVVCIGTVRSIGTNANAKFNAAKAGLL